MRQPTTTVSVIGLMVILLCTPISAQMGGSGMMGDDGMMCPMCGGTRKNPNGWNGQIPDKLPQPKSAEWIAKLKGIFAVEKLSQAQYTADESKYRVRMPYMMIIPQEQNHIAWIGGLFAAYGIKPGVETPPVKKSENVRQAYEIGRHIEAQSIPSMCGSSRILTTRPLGRCLIQLLCRLGCTI